MDVPRNEHRSRHLHEVSNRRLIQSFPLIFIPILNSSIEVITSSKRAVLKQDPYTGELVKSKVAVWNPTVANLTLMALGSSAPEILLNVIETVQTLGSKPGELGPSTIVGSAAFNFLMISGISIYAVHEGNDTRSKQERDDAGTPAGVKKVQDTGVFAITTVWSIVAYIWLYVVLLDGIVKEWEAYLTLGFFFALILMAYIADCMRRRTLQGREDSKFGHGHEVAPEGAVKKADTSNVRTLDAVQFYNVLLPQEAGQAEPTEENQQLSSEMREFLMQEFGTTKVSEVNKEDLKAKLDGPAFIERIGYRQKVAVSYKKEAIAKG